MKRKKERERDKCVTPLNRHSRPLSCVTEMSINCGGDGGRNQQQSNYPRGKFIQHSAQGSTSSAERKSRSHSQQIDHHRREGGRQNLIRGKLEAHYCTLRLTILWEIELILSEEEGPEGNSMKEGRGIHGRPPEKVSIKHSSTQVTAHSITKHTLSCSLECFLFGKEWQQNSITVEKLHIIPALTSHDRVNR